MQKFQNISFDSKFSFRKISIYIFLSTALDFFLLFFCVKVNLSEKICRVEFKLDKLDIVLKNRTFVVSDFSGNATLGEPENFKNWKAHSNTGER